MTTTFSTESDEIRLPEAARIARCSGDKLRRMVLSGQIAGRQNETARWLISRNSLGDYLKAERSRIVEEVASRVREFHEHRVSADRILRRLEATADEARLSGDDYLAETCSGLAQLLRKVDYKRDLGRYVCKARGRSPFPTFLD